MSTFPRQVIHSHKDSALLLGVLAEEVMLSYLLPRCDRDAPYTVHVGRVAIGVLGGGEVACTVLQGLSTGCQGKEMIRLLAAAAQSPQPSGFSSWALVPFGGQQTG